MARRIVMGNVSGTYDLRISRKGYDALTANVNDNRQISFSAQRAARAKVGAAGILGTLNVFQSFGRSFDYPPPTLMALKRNGRMYFNLYQYITPPDGTFYGNLYTLVVTPTRCKAVKCIPWAGYEIGASDRFQYYTLADD